MLIVIVVTVIFAVLHSITAGQRSKNWFRERFGERAYHGLYRLLYNVASVLLLVPVALAMWLTGDVIWVAPESWWPFLTGLQVIGLVGLLVSLIQIDFGQFTGLSQFVVYLQGDPLPLPEEPLQTGGLYALVRHPLYLFSLLAIWPMQTMTDTVLVFNIIATLYFIVGSRLEEKRLLAIFGEKYQQYRQRVPWLIPFPRP